LTPQRISDDVNAPFGYDEDGTVIAPYGLKADGTPRLSNRGRTAGAGFGGGGSKKRTAPAPPKKPTASKGPADKPTVRSNGQVDYTAAAVAYTSIAATLPGLAGGLPFVSKMIGERQSLALRGDTAILASVAEPLGEAIGAMAPRVSWLQGLLKGGTIPKDVFTLVTAIGQATAAIVENHRKPSVQLAEMGQAVTVLRVQRIMADLRATLDQEMEQAEQAYAEPQPAPAAEPEMDAETQRLADWYARHGAPPASAPTTDPGRFIPGQSTVYDFTEPPYSGEQREAS
jgi:hypothetical protein